MTEPQDRRDPIAAAERLQVSMDDLRIELADMRAYGQHNRRYIWGLAVSITLDIILSVVVAFVAVQASDASSLSNQNRQAAKATCESGNQARAISTQLWSYVLDLSSKNPESQTPERKAQIAQFRRYLESAYAPRDCEAANP